MSEQLSLALSLLLVGMLTVFIVLFLVVFIGNAIIAFVNRYMPESVQKEKAVSKSAAVESVDPNKMAVIANAVQILTQGKGRVASVEKIS